MIKVPPSMTVKNIVWYCVISIISAAMITKINKEKVTLCIFTDKPQLLCLSKLLSLKRLVIGHYTESETWQKFPNLMGGVDNVHLHLLYPRNAQSNLTAIWVSGNPALLLYDLG